MPPELYAVSVAAADPDRLAGFWADLLGYRVLDDPYGGPALTHPDLVGVRLRFFPRAQDKLGPNQLHFDLTSRTESDQQRLVAKALATGGRPADVGQRGDEGHVVLADPEDNEFCVVEPGNRFLAGCGGLGAFSCDGSRAVGVFWSAALDWPLVWDQDEETAIQAPTGGPKMSWGGPPLNPKLGPSRTHLDLRPGGDPAGAIERLEMLGATATGDPGEAGGTVLLDPDGNEFCLLPPATRFRNAAG